MLAFDDRDNSDAAGAICDIMTLNKMRELKMEIAAYLADNNAGGFFERVGGLILTGDTGSNVSDLIIAIKT